MQENADTCTGPIYQTCVIGRNPRRKVLIVIFERVIVVVIYRNVMLWFMIDCYSCVRGFDYDSLESIKSCREFFF